MGGTPPRLEFGWIEGIKVLDLDGNLILRLEYALIYAEIIRFLHSLLRGVKVFLRKFERRL